MATRDKADRDLKRACGLRTRHALTGLLVLTLSLSGWTTHAEEADNSRATAAAPNADRKSWWHAAHFGMFVHFGPYAALAGQWNGRSVSDAVFLQRSAKISIADYAQKAAEFNPQNFDADAIAELAASTGMKYVIFTAKHHDGFAMFHSQVSPFNLYDATPLKRDLVAEMAAACRKRGLRFGVYYSHARDWHHPGAAIEPRGSLHWDPAGHGDFDEYLRTVAVPQVRELLTNYGPIAELWFDTPNQMTAERADLFKPLLALQPRMLVNNRLGPGATGDFETPEQFIPAVAPKDRSFESCMTINHSWGFRRDDQDWKSTRTLLFNLTSVVSKGGNYLLNIGPQGDGSIPAPILDRLYELGQWMQANGESIHGATATPFRSIPWGTATAKPGKLFLQVFDWPADGRLVVPMSNPIRRAYLLNAPGKLLPSSNTADGVAITVPIAPADPIATVVVAEIDGEAQPVR